MTYPTPSETSEAPATELGSPLDDDPRSGPRPPDQTGRRRRPHLFAPAEAEPATTSPPPDGPDSAGGSAPGATDPVRPLRSDLRSTTKQRASTRRRLHRSIASTFGGLTLRANTVLARDAVEREYGPWVADDPEKNGVAAPVASFLSRRMGPDATSPDVADLIDALIAVAAYVSNALARRFELRRAVADGRIVVPPEPEPADAEADAGVVSAVR